MLNRFLTLTFALALAPLAQTGASATAQRTFVASTGNDANPCSLPQPCRGFARAVSQTSPSGEVIVLDSAGYGPVSIAKSVSIIAPPGVYAGVTVPAGGIGIDVFTPGVTVVIQGPQGEDATLTDDKGAKLFTVTCPGAWLLLKVPSAAPYRVDALVNGKAAPTTTVKSPARGQQRVILVFPQ